MAMNKDDFIKELSRTEKISLGEATVRVDSVLNGIVRATRLKGGVKFVGFGNFEATKTKARKGRNPQTGEALTIPENRKPKFTAGKIFKDAVALKGKAAVPVTPAPEAAPKQTRPRATANAASN